MFYFVCCVYTCVWCVGAHSVSLCTCSLQDSLQELVLLCQVSVWLKSPGLVQVFLSAKPFCWLDNCYFLIACCRFVYKSTVPIHLVICKVAENYFFIQYFF